MPARPLTSADVRDALEIINENLHSVGYKDPVLDNLIAALTWVPPIQVLAYDVTAGKGPAPGSEDPPKVALAAPKPVTLIAKC